MKEMKITGLHHIAIICSDIEASLKFYVDVLGCRMINETFRKERNSWKVDLELGGQYMFELFTFPDSPSRVSQPEAQGLRHLALTVENLDEAKNFLLEFNIKCEEERVDPFTGDRFIFTCDPDGLPIELVERLKR